MSLQLEKPFDFKALAQELKVYGLDLAEDTVKDIVKLMFDFTNQSLNLHPSPYLKVLPLIIAQIKPLLDEQVDKIDGQAG